MRQRADDSPLLRLSEDELETVLSVARYERSCTVDNRFTVHVFGYKVDADDDGGLVKFTSKEHGPSFTNTISLGTPEFYRRDRTAVQPDGSVDPFSEGVDPFEAEFVIESPGAEVTVSMESGASSPAAINRLGYNPGWIFCVAKSMRNPDFSETVEYFREQGHELMTPLRAPATVVAARLGCDFGRYGIPNIEVFSFVESMDTLRATGNGVVVLHGPVQYTEASTRHTRLHQLATAPVSPLAALEAVFTKQDKFARECEYRFLVCGWGPPREKQVILPLGQPMRDVFAAGPARNLLEVASVAEPNEPEGVVPSNPLRRQSVRALLYGPAKPLKNMMVTIPFNSGDVLTEEPRPG